MSETFSFEFCTLFDRGFLSRGIALIRSMERHFSSFRLHVLCLDEEVERILSGLKHPNLVLISLSHLERDRPALVAARNSRTRQEFCWTLTASLIEFCLIRQQLGHCTYLDADVWFVDPDVAAIQAELQDCSVYITPHGYAPEYDQSSNSGTFCVQFVFIRNDETGMKIVRQWAEQCIEWCHARVDGGRFGDQKYLDEWPRLASSVRVSSNPGLGVAPWNAVLFEPGEGESVRHRSGWSGSVAMYHFHGLRLADEGALLARRYRIPGFIQDRIYVRYLDEIRQIEHELPQARSRQHLDLGWRDRLRRLIRPEEFVIRSWRVD